MLLDTSTAILQHALSIGWVFEMVRSKVEMRLRDINCEASYKCSTRTDHHFWRCRLNKRAEVSKKTWVFIDNDKYQSVHFEIPVDTPVV